MSPNPDLVERAPHLERRAVAELRAAHRKIVGYAVVFDARSQDLGGFRELVRAQAVADTFGDSVVALYNHDPGAVLGRTPATLRLEKDTRGLLFELDPANTQAGQDTLTLVQRGDIKGASIGFTTTRDAWHREDSGMVRELLAINIREISLTAFPAYTQTDVAVAQRSLLALGSGSGGRSVAALRRALRCGATKIGCGSV